MKKLINFIGYKLSIFFLKRSVIFYTDYYMDQFETFETKGKYGKTYIRLDRSIPDHDKMSALKI